MSLENEARVYSDPTSHATNADLNQETLAIFKNLGAAYLTTLAWGI